MAGDSAATATAELHYRDPAAAIAWLEAAFGFDARMIVSDASGRIAFAQIGLGEASVNIVPETAPGRVSPAACDGRTTQTVQIRGLPDIDAHCARARAAGAEIVQAPELFFFGDRTYLASDIEGHLWSFAQPVPGAAGPPPEGWSVRFPGRDGSGT